MNRLFYSSDPAAAAPQAPVELPAPRRHKRIGPEAYKADDGLAAAVNVALLLGQPLLVTGEPGTGKTQLAYSVAWQLGLGEPFKFETKSSTTARDLFYTYDALGRFQARRSHAAAGPLAYITYHALGLAILHANEKADLEGLLPADFEHRGRRRSVVLIDEIDKAPRDFPNDVLNEIEGMYFRVPELGSLGNRRVAAPPELQPVVVITSNSEKDLPDAFLRRCIYYNIPFPKPDRMRSIITGRLGELTAGEGDLLGDALDLFFQLRGEACDLRKPPSTAELLGWLAALRTLGGGTNPFAGARDAVLQTLSTLIKTLEDKDKATRVVEQWFKSHDR